MTSEFNRTEPDPALILKAKGGDQEALRSLIDSVSPSVGQWALAWSGDEDTAADLTQEVLILMIRKLDGFRGESRFLTWLFKVTRNQAIEAHRTEKRKERKMDRLRVDLNTAPSQTASPDTAVDARRIRSVLEIFLRDLPSRQREVFQMSEVGGLSSPEIGRILGLAPGAVRSALFKARRALREKILEKHPELVEEYLK